MERRFPLTLVNCDVEGLGVGAPLELPFMAECDRMEEELAAWLCRHWETLTPRVQRPEPGVQTRCGMPVVLGRTLVTIWCTSPRARSLVSDDARQGFLAALEAMDDPEACLIIEDLLEHGRKETPHRPMAA